MRVASVFPLYLWRGSPIQRGFHWQIALSGGQPGANREVDTPGAQKRHGTRYRVGPSRAVDGNVRDAVASVDSRNFDQLLTMRELEPASPSVQTLDRGQLRDLGSYQQQA